MMPSLTEHVMSCRTRPSACFNNNTLYTKLNYDIIGSHMIKPLDSRSLSASRSDRRASRSDRRASRSNRRASRSDRRASRSDRRASRSDRRASRSDRSVLRRRRNDSSELELHREQHIEYAQLVLRVTGTTYRSSQLPQREVFPQRGAIPHREGKS